MKLLQYKKTGEVGWTTGRANKDGMDLNRNFPDVDGMYFKIVDPSSSMPRKHGRNHHLYNFTQENKDTVSRSGETSSLYQGMETKLKLYWDTGITNGVSCMLILTDFCNFTIFVPFLF